MKTMNKIIFWTMAAFAFLFASCAGEEEVATPANPLKNKPINVEVLVSDIKTRAGYDNTSLPTKFYLTIDQGGEDYDYNNVVMKYEDNKWVAYESDAANANKVEMHWAGSEGNITVKAATFSLAEASTTLSALTDQSTAEAIKSSDHLCYYSDAVMPSSDGTISIPLDHVMSKLEVKVTLRTQYGGSDTNPIASAVAFGSAISATYTIAEATPWSNKSAASDITPCLSAPYNSTNRIATYEAILIPQEIASNTFGVTVTIGDKSYTWKSANPITLQGGMKYTLDLTLGKNELTLNTLSVGEWNKETVTGLNAEPVIPYVTFTAEKSQTFTMNFKPGTYEAFSMGDGEYFEYSVGHGEWVRFKTTVENIPFGGTEGSLRLRGKSSKGTFSGGYSTIEFTTENSPVDCTGDIRTLIDYENYADVSTADAKFYRLFCQNTQLRTPPSLPATTLTESCYEEMFKGCTALTKAPELPATTLADWCYQYMFLGCTALTEAPELPATTLAGNCYNRMFLGCTALTKAPSELPATTLKENCCEQMFYGCTALTQAPALPAETLAYSCYNGMFYGCTALTKAPALPATTLAGLCYQSMFWGCTALTQAPSELPATTLADWCYQYMFLGCTALTQSPVLRATTLANNCYKEMFSGCSQLSSVTMLATNIYESYASSYFSDWLTNAGTSAQSRKLYLSHDFVEVNQGQLDNFKGSLIPENWEWYIYW